MKFSSKTLSGHHRQEPDQYGVLLCDQEKEGGTQEFLLRLRGSKLQDDAILEEFYDKIIEYYDYGENYYIILIHAVYDIPGKSHRRPGDV